MDANPLNKSLPAEVVSRRRPQVKKSEVKAVDEIEVDLNTALSLKPEARVKWLTRAFEMAKDGKAPSRELFDIISNRRFTAGLPSKIGRRILSIAHECASLFSERQQRYMQSSEWILNAKYGGEKDEARDHEDKGLDDLDKDNVNDSQRDESPKRYSSREDGDNERPRRRAGSEERPLKSEMERREALEQRLAAEERERRVKREQRKKQAQVDEFEDFTSRFLEKKQTSRQQVEDEVDSSLQMLERLKQPEAEASPPRRRRRRRHDSRSPHVQAPNLGRERRGNRRRDASRSGSISVQAATPSASPSPKRQRNNGRNDRRGGGGGGGGGGGESFEDALRRRMAQRESEDSTRIPVTWTREDMRRGRHLENRSKWAAGGKPIS